MTEIQIQASNRCNQSVSGCHNKLIPMGNPVDRDSSNGVSINHEISNIAGHINCGIGHLDSSCI